VKEKRFTLLLSVINLIFCQSLVQSQNVGQMFCFDKNIPVIILPVSVRYLDQKTDILLRSEHYGGPVASHFFWQEFNRILLTKSFSVSAVDTSSNVWSDLQIAHSGLFRSTLRPSLLATLKDIGQVTNCRYLLATQLRVKVGEDAEWIPLSVVFYGKTHNTRIKAILIDTETGTLLWKNEVEFKEIPDPHSRKFMEAIQLTFFTLKTK